MALPTEVLLELKTLALALEKPQFRFYPPCPCSHSSTTASACQQEPREAEENQRGSDRTYLPWQVQKPHKTIDVLVFVVLDIGTGL